MKSQPAPFVLASLLTSYPTLEMDQSVQILLDDHSVEVPENLRSLILERTSMSKIEDLQSEYVQIFDLGRAANPIYETEYGRSRAMAKGNELSDIAGFYHAFGFELDAGSEHLDMLDHVGVELEFYALMLMKQIRLEELGDSEGIQIVESGRKEFLKAHLGRFVQAIGNRPGVENSEFYRSVLIWSSDLIDEECKILGLNVDKVDWVEGQKTRTEDISCDVSGSCKN